MDQKNIVIWDGTGNSAVKDRGTNVFKLYESVDLNLHRQFGSLCPQVAFYDDGVGTESRPHFQFDSDLSTFRRP